MSKMPSDIEENVVLELLKEANRISKEYPHLDISFSNGNASMRLTGNLTVNWSVTESRNHQENQKAHQ